MPENEKTRKRENLGAVVGVESGTGKVTMNNNLLSAKGQDNSDVEDWLIIEKSPTSENFIPKPLSLQEAVDIIRTTYQKEELQAWAANSEGEAGGLAHFCLGMWIRNQWVYQQGSPLTEKMKTVNSFIQPDTISSIIIKALWRVLNGLPCPAIEELVKPSPHSNSLE